MSFVTKLCLALFASALLASHVVQAESLNNQASIAGATEMKVLYDMRKANPKLLLAYLRGVESNRVNLEKEGVTNIKQRIIFIADAVKYITTHPADDVVVEHGDVLPLIAEQIARLGNLGVEMEVCSAATAAFNVDNSTLLPGIQPVRSGFLSVMGWQKQGYQLVPVYN